MPQRDKLSTDPLYMQIRKLLAERAPGSIWRPDEAPAGDGPTVALPDLVDAKILRPQHEPRIARATTRPSGEKSVLLTARHDGIRRRITGSVQLLTQSHGPATAPEQQRLQLCPEAAVLRTTRLRRDESRVVMYETAFLALDRFPDLEPGDFGNYDILSLAQSCGIHLMHAQERLASAPAPRGAADHLGVTPGSPLLRLDRVLVARGGKPIEWRIGLCHTRKSDEE